MPRFAPFAKPAGQGIVRRLLLRPYGLGLALALLVLPLGLFAQAVVEYALQSGSSALSHIGDSAIGGCNIDSGLVRCLGRTYPRAAIAVVVVLGLLMVRWLAGATRSKAR